jgi:hypothetical protein
MSVCHQHLWFDSRAICVSTCATPAVVCHSRHDSNPIHFQAVPDTGKPVSQQSFQPLSSVLLVVVCLPCLCPVGVWCWGGCRISRCASLCLYRKWPLPLTWQVVLLSGVCGGFARCFLCVCVSQCCVVAFLHQFATNRVVSRAIVKHRGFTSRSLSHGHVWSKW